MFCLYSINHCGVCSFWYFEKRLKIVAQQCLERIKFSDSFRFETIILLINFPSYVAPNVSSKNVEFSIPVNSCGTNSLDIDAEDGEQPRKGFENIVVFQNDPVYQEMFDHARMVVCRYSVDDDFDMKDKRVIFKPIVIDMLDVVSVSCIPSLDWGSHFACSMQIPIQDERGVQSRVDCWMEISKGRFPETTEIDSAIKVGTPLTLAIFVRDPRKRTDIRIKDCYGLFSMKDKQKPIFVCL